MVAVIRFSDIMYLLNIILISSKSMIIYWLLVLVIEINYCLLTTFECDLIVHLYNIGLYGVRIKPNSLDNTIDIVLFL